MKLDPKNSFQNAADTSAFVMPSAWFEDFSFGKTMFEALNGNAEALSGVGTGVSDIALQERVKLEAERRKEDGPDASMIAELGAQQREELSAMQSVTYSDSQFHMFGMDIDEEDMDAEMEESETEIDAQATKYGWDDATKAQMALLYAQFNDPDAMGDEKAEVFDRMREVGGEEWAEDRAEEAHERKSINPDRDLSASEQEKGAIATIEDAQVYEEANLEIVDRVGVAERAVDVRSGLSNAGNPFGDTRGPSSEFNAQASGDVQLAEVTPLQAAPDISGPTLLNG